MAQMHAEQIIIEALKEEGVNFWFGSVGQDLLSLLDYLYRDGSIKLVDTRHEHSGVMAAVGYSKATGELSVCSGTEGPGVANMFHGIFSAWRSFAPVVAIVCKRPSGFDERWAGKCFDQSAAFRGVTKWVTDVDRIEHLADALQRAFRVALTPPTGPVMVCVSDGLFGRPSVPGPQLDVELPKRDTYRPASSLVCADGALVRQAAQMLVDARFPALLVDTRCFWNQAQPEVASLAELLAMPVCSTDRDFRPILSEEHPLCWGLVGRRGTSLGNNLLQGKADLLVMVDCVLDTSQARALYNTSDSQARVLPECLIQIDSAPEYIASFQPVKLGMLGNSKAVLRQIIEEVSRRELSHPARAERMRSITKAKEEWLATIEGEIERVKAKHPISPLTLCRALSETTSDDSYVVVDGATIVFAFDLLGVYMAGASRRVLTKGSSGGLGHSVATAIGVKVAHPDRQVVALCGDGEFWYGNALELETLRRHKLPITIVISDNGSFGNERVVQNVHYQGRHIGTTIDNPDFVLLARSFGMYGERVERPGDIGPALERAFRSGRPALVDVATDPDETIPGSAYSYSRYWPF